MLTEIHIEGFKSLYSVDVSLGQVNLFIGANGSGKTAFLESIGVLGAAASGRVDNDSLSRRGVRPSVPAVFKSSFQDLRTKQHIRFEAAWTDPTVQYAVSLYNPIDMSDIAVEAWRFKHESLTTPDGGRPVGRSPRSKLNLDETEGLAALKRVELPADSGSSQLLSELRGFSVLNPSTPHLRGVGGVLPSGAPDNPVGLFGARLPDAIRAFLKLLSSSEGQEKEYFRRVNEDLFEVVDWMDKFGVRMGRKNVPLSPHVSTADKIVTFRDRHMASSRSLLTAFDASEGALHVLFAAMVAALPSMPSVVAVDNFDQALNPVLSAAVMRRFSQWVVDSPSSRQVLLTSHNPAILDGLDLEDDRIRLFVVERALDGTTDIHRLKPDRKLRDLMEDKGWPLSRLWQTGMIGGTPNV